MSIEFEPFIQQDDFLFDEHRVKGAFSGKRGGKTEIGAIQGIKFQEEKPNYRPSIDPYLGVIAAPTTDMLRRLSWKKFEAYAKKRINKSIKNPYEIIWNDSSEIYGISADRPARLEGLKANWIWIDEVFQVTEQFFLECLARVSDQQGYIFCTGSLGVQFINPKLHWVYKYFKENPDEDTICYEWATADNPYFLNAEIQKLKDKLDPQTFRMMFTINWDTIPSGAVYHQFDEGNVQNVIYNPYWPCYVCIDWGWAHPMACGFFQHDVQNDIVYLVDEIVSSRLKIDKLYEQIMAKPYRIRGWYCDISGNQEREQTGMSNIGWFEKKGINFDYRSTAVTYGIPIVRRYVKNGKGRSKFIINAPCVKSIDGMKQYRYAEKNGIIQNENPVKENDDCVDMIRYFYVNHIDEALKDKREPEMLPR